MLIKRFKSLLGTLALVLAVCLPGIATGAKAPSGEPIVIGSPLPISGYYAGDGLHMKNAITLAVEDINASGGVLGRPLEVKYFDIQNMTPEDLTAAADQLVVRDGVAAVVAGYAGMGPDVAAFGKYDTIFIHNDATANTAKMVSDNYGQFSNVFMMSWWGEEPWGVEDFVAATNYPFDFRNKKVAVLASEFEWDIKVSEAFTKTAKKNGWEVVMEEIFPGDATEWGPLIAKIRSKDPSLIFFSAQNPDSDITFVRQFKENPVDALVDLSVSIWWTGVVDSLGSDGDGIVGWVTQQELPGPNNPTGRELTEKYKARFGVEPQASWVFAYDAVGLWASAAERAGTAIDQDMVKAELLKVPYEGFGGRYTFDRNHGNSVRPSEYQPNYHGQIQNGVFCPVLITAGQNPEEGTATVKPFPYDGACKFKTPSWTRK